MVHAEESGKKGYTAVRLDPAESAQRRAPEIRDNNLPLGPTFSDISKTLAARGESRG